jgi:hypothetical protein
LDVIVGEVQSRNCKLKSALKQVESTIPGDEDNRSEFPRCCLIGELRVENVEQ